MLKIKKYYFNIYIYLKKKHLKKREQVTRTPERSTIRPYFSWKKDSPWI